jgi:hypothetical protein
VCRWRRPTGWRGPGRKRRDDAYLTASGTTTTSSSRFPRVPRKSVTNFFPLSEPNSRLFGMTNWANAGKLG